MYLTDFREYSLKDVIMQLEPELFRKVTGLTLKDFELLVSLGVFNSDLMNDAVYKFKRYEDSSLEYAGIDKHAGTIIGLWDKTIDKAENETIEENVTKETAPEIVKEPWLELQVGDRVTHKSFGPGDVMSIDEKYIFVHFPDVEKKFLYPDAFEKGYLSC